MEIRRRGNYIFRDKNICGQPSTTRARRRNVEKVTLIVETECQGRRVGRVGGAGGRGGDHLIDKVCN